MSVSRRTMLVLTGTLAAASALPTVGSTPAASASEDLSTSESPIFYVAASGNDLADGLSPNSPWATIQKANSSVPAGGSVLLFRRDDTFFGELQPPTGCEVGAYGSGARPVLTMFKLLNRPESWTEESDGVWKIDLRLPNSHEGYTSTLNANFGFLVVDGAVQPALKFELAELSAPWDFYCDVPNRTLYIAASDNPTALAADIKAAPNGRIISCEGGSNEIHDLHLTGTGGCGIGGVAPDVHIYDCQIDYIGGSNLRDGTQRRYGNGIENWVNVKRWLIEGNEIAQVYDVAWTPQGRAGPNGSWEDMTFRNNHIHDCTQSFEFWSSGTESAGGYKRILVEGNLCERAGYSVFSDFRPDQNVRVHLLTYLWNTPADISIQNNVFDDVYGAYSYHAFEPVGLVTRSNTIRVKPGTKMEYQRSETVEQFAEWRDSTGREIGSDVTILP